MLYTDFYIFTNFTAISNNNKIDEK